jgi:hypothetical protein
LARDTASAIRMLTRLGIGRGDHVLFLSILPQVAQSWPYQAAVVELGGIIANAESTALDAARAESLSRWFTFAAIIGVTPGTLDGLRSMGASPDEVLRRAGLILATPSAAAQLEGIADRLRTWALLGPTVAIGCTAARLHIDTSEWLPHEAADGKIAVRSTSERAIGRGPFATGVTGAVLRAPCPCGWPEASLVPSQVAEF